MSTGNSIQFTDNDSENSEIIRKVVSKFLEKIPDPNCQLLFGMCAGSRAFNLNVATSDFDWFGIYVGGPDVMLGLEPVKQALHSKEGAVEDYALYEVAYFCELLQKGNPKLVEPLFAPKLVYSTPEFDALKKEGDLALTKVSAEQYISYGGNKIHNWKKDPTNFKHMYHAVRLLWEAERIVEKKPPRVWFPDGPERDFLISIRKGEQQGDDLIKKCNQLTETSKKKLPDLPDKLDITRLSRWLEEIRLRGIRSEQTRVEPEPDHTKTQLDLCQRATQLLSAHKIDAAIVCVIPSGSTAYGLKKSESSPDDFIAIYACPTRQVVSLNPPPQRVDEQGVNPPQKQTFCRGFSMFEVSYACSQIMAGNHRFIEALCYDKSDAYQTKTWKELKKFTKDFLFSSALLSHIIGVVEGKRKQSLTNKTKYHSIRLLTAACKIGKGESPDFFSLAADEILQLQAIYDGKANDDQTEKLAQSLLSQATELKKKFPKKTTKSDISQWLINIRNGFPKQ